MNVEIETTSDIGLRYNLGNNEYEEVVCMNEDLLKVEKNISEIITEFNLKNIIKEKYILYDIIGQGSFGSVYLGQIFNSDHSLGKKLAIKRFFNNINPKLIELEIKMLEYISKNVDPEGLYFSILIDGFLLPINEAQPDIFIVQDYIENNKVTDFNSLKALKQYLFSLLSCLEVLDKFHIIHRDLKSDNFLYDTKTCTGKLIDFGISEIDKESLKRDESVLSKSTFYQEINHEHKQLKIHNRAGTRGFLAPEVIFNYSHQTSKVDIWAAGCMIINILTQKIPFFVVDSKNDNLNRYPNLRDLLSLIIVYGREKIIESSVLYDCGIHIPTKMQDDCIPDGIRNKMIYKFKFIEEFENDGGFELLEKLLELDFKLRYSAKQAKCHKFFDEIR